MSKMSLNIKSYAKQCRISSQWIDFCMSKIFKPLNLVMSLVTDNIF